MYAAIRQGKAKAGMVEELTRRIKEGAIPIISDVPGFMGYYVVYAGRRVGEIDAVDETDRADIDALDQFATASAKEVEPLTMRLKGFIC